MRTVIFGTYDTAMHPRIATIAEGLAARGFDVAECNIPLGLSTADRVDMLAKPWKAARLAVRLGNRWLGLAAKARSLGRPDAVVVGYLGHFDVHLARLLYRRGKVPIVLDHLISAAGTAKDRRIAGGGLKTRLLTLIDAAALRAADIVVVDTEEHLETVPDKYRAKAVVVHVGAPAPWFAAARHAGRRRAAPADPRGTAQGRLLRAVHAAAGHSGHRRGPRPHRRRAGRGDHDRPRPGRGGDQAARRGQHVRALARLGARRRAARARRRARRLPRHLRHRRQGAAGGAQQGVPGRRRRMRGRHVRHRAAAPGARTTPPCSCRQATRRRWPTRCSGWPSDREALLKLRHAARQLAAERFTPEQVVGPLTDRLLPPHAGA